MKNAKSYSGKFAGSDFSHDLSGKPVISGNNVTVKNNNTASDDPLAKAVEEQNEDVQKNELNAVGNQETSSKNESNDTSAKVGEEQTGDVDDNMEAAGATSSDSDSESESGSSDESEDESEVTSDAESDKDDGAKKELIVEKPVSSKNENKNENASNVSLPVITSNQDIKNANSKTDQIVTSSNKSNQDLNESKDESKNMVTIESLKKELQNVAGSGTKRAASNTSTPEKHDVETREENKVKRDKKKSKAAAEKKPGEH
jgi:hypothetical protein